MNKKDYLLQMIKERYGKNALIDPRATGSGLDEEEIRKQLLKFDEKVRKARRKNEKVEKNGFFISKGVLKRANVERVCPVCNTFSFSTYDDVYMMRFKCCFECYIQHVDGREKQWLENLKKNEENNEK